MVNVTCRGHMVEYYKMDNQNGAFDSWSFGIGLFAGFALRATDVVPLTGGIILGLCIRNLPDMVQIRQFPQKIQDLLLRMTNKKTEDNLTTN